MYLVRTRTKAPIDMHRHIVLKCHGNTLEYLISNVCRRMKCIKYGSGSRSRDRMAVVFTTHIQ
jgi:hypothetical protein